MAARLLKSVSYCFAIVVDQYYVLNERLAKFRVDLKWLAKYVLLTKIRVFYDEKTCSRYVFFGWANPPYRRRIKQTKSRPTKNSIGGFVLQ